jgi:Icc-related predicted phosphoesterase
MNILAVADIPSRLLEAQILRTPESLKGLDVIISCGDLEKEYLEFLVDGINRELFFVFGNHQGGWDLDEDIDLSPGEKMLAKARHLQQKIAKRIAGIKELHGRVVPFHDYLMVGFGGSMWYNGGENQYTEKEMSRVVSAVTRKVNLLRLSDRLLGRPAKEVIVITHAPPFGIHDQPDLCHTGFKCFNTFRNEIRPLLWLHGHIHLLDTQRNQITVEGRTTILNTYSHKFISIKADKIDISSRPFAQPDSGFQAMIA